MSVEFIVSWLPVYLGIGFAWASLRVIGAICSGLSPGGVSIPRVAFIGLAWPADIWFAFLCTLAMRLRDK